MSSRIIVLIILILSLSCSPNIFADTIELKNGEKVIGDILQETDEGIVMSKQNGKFVYSISRDRIKSIRKSTEEEEKRRKRKEDNFYRVDKKKIAEQKEKQIEYRQEQYKKEVLSADKTHGRTRIYFENNKFGLVQALLNDKITALLLVDTGASLVAISKNLAEQLEINYDNLPEMKIILADGTEVNARKTTLDSIKVGNARAENVKIAITETSPDTEIDGLLGMSFLRYFHMKLDAKEKCLILEKY